MLLHNTSAPMNFKTKNRRTQLRSSTKTNTRTKDKQNTYHYSEDDTIDRNTNLKRNNTL